MKILVVDDNDINLHLLVAILSRNHYDVITANDGLEAISVFEEQRPDLVLMDIMMPGMDGRECTTRLKQIAGDIYIPIIYVTALSQETALSTALAAGGDDFVTKPVNFAILLSKVQAHGRIQELNNELNQKNRQLAQYNRSLQRDQELAAHYFKKALKHSYLDPSFIRHHLSSASAFNGDLLMAAPRPGGGLYVILGDFTGHGLGASIGSLPVAQIFFNLTRQGAWIGDIAREINHELRNLLPDDMFLAATLVELNSTGKRLAIWAGGLPDAYLLDTQNHTHRIIKSQYPPLGILDDDRFNPATDSYSVCHDERLYLYTDGVIETKNASGECYGSERLQELFLQHEADTFDQIINSLHQFIGHESQRDDTSFAELICKPIADRYDNHDTDHDAVNKGTLIPCQLTFELFDAELKNGTDVVSNLAKMICAAPGLSPHKGVIHTILAEIYTNFLEHGLLNLNSEHKCDDAGFNAYYEQKQESLKQAKDLYMRFDIAFQPGSPRSRLTITATHNAEHTQRIPASSAARKPGTLSCGHGILLLENLCEEVNQTADGNCITVNYLV